MDHATLGGPHAMAIELTFEAFYIF